jgi:cobaltochelatase CobN
MNIASPNQSDAVLLLTTKRLVLAQISLCKGCCCGNVERGKPEVPVDRLKSEWRTRGLSKFVQLTISGCLGPCDLVNVARLSTNHRDIWLGNLRSLDDFLELVTWAEAFKDAGHAGPLSPRMEDARFDPFRKLLNKDER